MGEGDCWLRDGEASERKMAWQKYKCPVCRRPKYAHRFEITVNAATVRDIRLFCVRCVEPFGTWTRAQQLRFIRGRIEQFYGEAQFIYGLGDPRDGETKYIGRSRNPEHRFRAHLRGAKKPRHDSGPPVWNNLPSARKWISELLAIELKPELRILETVTPGVRVCEREMRWICEAIRRGDKILNAENSTTKLRLLIQRQAESFMTVSIDKLIRTRFIQKMENLLHEVLRESGWRRVVLINSIYKRSPRITVAC